MSGGWPAQVGAPAPTMKIPFSRPTINPADISRVSGQLASGRLDTGPQVQLFEEALARFLSVPAAHVIATSSCTHAIELALRILKPPAVGIPALTWVADANAATATNTPIQFYDCDDEHWVADTVIHVPLYGQLSHTPPTATTVIEDYAHAFGAKSAGGIPSARFRTFSFAPTKIMTTIHGGALICRFVADAQQARLMARQGNVAREAFQPGYHYNMNDVSAALGRSQLSRVPARRQRLKELAKRYLQSDVIRRAAYRPFRDSGEIWHLFPLMIPNRDTFRRKLARAGVETSIHYQALTSMPAYAHLVRCPEAERLGESLVSLPLYPTLTDEEQDHVICATEAAL